MRPNTPPRILTIAGSDPSGGAGIQADLKTIAALGGYGMSALTALTAQNTLGVFGIHPVPCDFIAQQIKLVTDDVGVDVFKTGMLHSAEVIETVADCLGQGARPLVLDPVMVSTSGHALLEPDAIAALETTLIPRATLVTPNLPEAELLSGTALHSTSDMERAAPIIAAYGCPNLLLKGGHGQGDTIHDLLWMNGTVHWFTSPRIVTTSTHGTGCTLASAIATLLGHGLALPEAVAQAREYVAGAIAHAPGFGKGHGPLWHGWQSL